MKTTGKNTATDSALVAEIKRNIASDVAREKREGEIKFAKLFNKYKHHMQFVCGGINSVDAVEMEDIVMQAMEKSYEKLTTYNAESSAFSTWLYKIFRNSFIDYLRRKDKYITVTSFIQVEDSDSRQEKIVNYVLFKDNSETIVEKIERDETCAVVRVAVEKLSSDFFKTIIKMKYFNNMAYDEIAEETGKPLGTIKASIFRAKEELRGILSNSMLAR